MMFFSRAFMVALGFFGVVYCLLSLFVVCVWRCAGLFFRKSAVPRVRLLFAIRILPLLASAFITLVFAVPAFVLLEGGKIDEDAGTVLFSVCTLLLIAAGVLRVLAAQARASRVLADWLEGARALDAGVTGPILQAKTSQAKPLQTKQAPPLLLYGVSTPQILASNSAVELLSSEELRVAVQHEIGHMHSRDNLKKLLFSATSFPGMKSLERVWQDAAEFAADEAAVSNSGEAVDLASALLKLAELAPSPDLPAFTTGLVNCTALVRLRVERLLEWKESSAHQFKPRFQRLWWCSIPPALLVVSYVASHYGQALLFTHRFTEWFIR
jgi:Zn-dependent protease with chaperone function